MTNYYLNIALFLIGLAFTCLCWFIGWRQLYLDRYRQSLFEIRDNLFDIARAGAIDFSDPLYGKMRNALHLRIRFAHRFNVVDFLTTRFLIEKYDIEIKDFYGERIKLIEKISNIELREKLLAIENHANLLTVEYFVHSSATLHFVIQPLIAILLAVKIIREGYKRKLDSDLKRRVILMDNASESDENGPMLAF